MSKKNFYLRCVLHCAKAKLKTSSKKVFGGTFTKHLFCKICLLTTYSTGRFEVVFARWLWVADLQLSSSSFPRSSSSSSTSSSGSRCPWQGLVGVIWLGPSRLVPSCSLRMCRTTAVALNACCRSQKYKKKNPYIYIYVYMLPVGQKIPQFISLYVFFFLTVIWNVSCRNKYF